MKTISLAAVLASSLVSSAGAEETARIVSSLPDGTLIISGTWRKPAPGQVDIPFGTTFSAPPIVVVSPVYTSAVGAIETVVSAQTDKFTVVSANAAPNFYVNWIAMGKK